MKSTKECVPLNQLENSSLLQLAAGLVMGLVVGMGLMIAAHAEARMPRWENDPSGVYRVSEVSGTGSRQVREIQLLYTDGTVENLPVSGASAVPGTPCPTLPKDPDWATYGQDKERNCLGYPYNTQTILDVGLDKFCNPRDQNPCTIIVEEPPLTDEPINILPEIDGLE